MKIKKNTSRANTITIFGSILVIVLLTVFIISKKQGFSKNKTVITNDLESPTALSSIGANYQSLLKGDTSKIYESDTLKIYAVNKSGKAFVIYAYKNEPSGRQVTDKFFLHLYLKSDEKLMGNAKFVNVDFIQEYRKIKVNNEVYYVYAKELISSNYEDKEVPLQVIDHIRTGRNKPGADRSMSLKIPLNDLKAAQLKSNFDHIDIEVTAKDFNKIINKREEALQVGILSSSEDDLIKGKIKLNDSELKDIKLRLKGDWADHLRDSRKWSFRILMEDGETLKGMRKFSIQHPKVRDYAWEWLINKVIKDEDIIGLRYDFAEVNLNVEGQPKIPVGIMAVEEAFDKILIENNKRRAGVIIAIDESAYWADNKKRDEFNLDKGKGTLTKEIVNLKNAPIKLFNENKVLSSPELSKQFEAAKDLLDGLRTEKYTISEVFDIDKVTTFVAVKNLFGGVHGLIWHNLRMYYNPITGKLEPVSYDSMSGRKLSKIVQYPLAGQDSIYKAELRKKFKLVSSTQYIDNFINKHKDELINIQNNLYTEFTNIFDESILTYNSNYIKKYLDPSLQITAGLVSFDDKEITVDIKNVSGHPVIIDGLAHNSGRALSIHQSQTLIQKDSTTTITFNLNKYYQNAFVSKKNKKGGFRYPNDVSKLKITHHIKGIDLKRSSFITPFSTNPYLNESIEIYRNSKISNIDQFDFIETQADSIITFKKGNYTLSKDLILPKNQRVIIEPGFSVDIKNRASIKSHSAFECIGTIDNPIKFYSSNNSSGGIFITNTSSQSKISYTIFDNLSNPQLNNWSVSGAVNFHESDVIITHSTFSNNRCEDALNIIRSSFEITNSIFKNTQSDAFDGDFTNGIIKDCKFVNPGNDGIDISGSKLTIKNIEVINPSDKGISAGEDSNISGNNITISGGEIGIVSKDLSVITLSNVKISDIRLGLSAFQKKSEYGIATIDIKKLTLINTEEAHLVEVNSKVSIDDVFVETVSNNVIDQMYGKEYGKSSR